VLLSGCAHVALTSLAAEPWVEAQTEHIRVRTTLSASAAEKIASQIERERREMLLIWGPQFNPAERLQVVVLQTAEAEDVLGRRYSGFFSVLDQDGQLLLSSAGVIGDGTSATVRLHEMAHAIMYSGNHGRLPRWVSEGFADYLGSVNYLEAGQVEFGRVKVDSLRLLRQHARIDGNRLRAWERDDGLSALDLSLHYATAWGWVLYLMNTEPDAFERYLTELIHGRDEPTAWLTAFATRTIDSMDLDFNTYLRQGNAAVITLPMPAVTLTAASRPMTEAERHAVIGRLMLSGFHEDWGPAKEQARMALSTEPKLPEALALMRSIELRERASGHVADASSSGPPTALLEAALKCDDVVHAAPLELGERLVGRWFAGNSAPMNADETLKVVNFEANGGDYSLLVGPPQALADVKPPTAILVHHKAGGTCVINTWATSVPDAKVSLSDVTSVVDPKTQQAVFLLKVDVVAPVGAKTHWVLLASDGPRLWSPTKTLGGHAIMRAAALKLAPDGIRVEFRNTGTIPLVYRLENDQFVPVTKSR
jgi:hypothetical protein